MRVIRAILWSIVGVMVGAFQGATLGWGLDSSITDLALVGGLLGLVIGILYGLFAPRTVPEPATNPGKPKVSFERCAWCQGSGWEDPKKQRRCNTCEGEGRVLVAVPPHACNVCKGKGRLFPKRKCKQCDGAGWENYSLLRPAPVPQDRPDAPKKRISLKFR